MGISLLIHDETLQGTRQPAITLELPETRMTIRDLIRERVYQEVQDFNLKGGREFKGLVQPDGTIHTPQGYVMKTPRTIDWKPQFERALAAFGANQIIVLVDDRQVESLDEMVELRAGTSIGFLKLIPLVGG